jgi:hypothetical protein
MTDWRERRLGAGPRSRGARKRSEGQAAAARPLIIAIAVRRKARDHAEEALEALMALVREASSEHVRVAAANAILDRALGKPLPGAKAAAEETDAEEEAGPLEVRWLGEE